MADLIEAAMNSMPKRGFISGPSLLMLQGLVSLLRDPASLLEHGQKVIEGHSPNQILNTLTHSASHSHEEEECPFPLTTGGPQFVDSLGLW